MNRQEKQKYLNLPTIAYYDEFGGIEIKKLQFDGKNAFVVFVANAWYPGRTVYKARLHTIYGRLFFRYHLLSIYCDECVRLEVM